MGKDGGQWELEDEEGQNGGGQGEMRWQVVENKVGGGDGDEGRRGGMRQREMDKDDRRDEETFRGQRKTKIGGQWKRRWWEVERHKEGWKCAGGGGEGRIG